MKFIPLVMAIVLSMSLLTGCADTNASIEPLIEDQSYTSASEVDVSTDTNGNAAIAVEPGEMVLDAPLITSGGSIYHLSDFTPSDKPLYIVFWEDWCPQCQTELPILQTIYEEYKDSVSFVTINRADSTQEDTSLIETYIRENNFTFPVYYNINDEATTAYGHPSIPTNIFVFPDGTISEVYTDTTDMTEEMIRSALDTILSGS